MIGLFEGTIHSRALAAALMTIVAAQGGNAGVQTLTVMVRGMATGKVGLAQARGILLKELAVASSVFVTACTDVCGFFSFLGLLSIGLGYFV